jgi:hypothetical protein
MPVVSSISSSEALKMSEIYSDCRISDSSRDRAEVNIVDADDGESDEVEFGDVGEDNVGEDIIMCVVLDNVRDRLDHEPLNVGTIAGGARDCEGGTRESNTGWVFDPEHGLLFAH